MRLYWVDVHRNKVEIFAGPSWRMMTPNHAGISPCRLTFSTAETWIRNYRVHHCKGSDAF
jgi:hypothetical protein